MHPTVGIVHDARTVEMHGYFAQLLIMCEHTGSHVDAPAHVATSLANATIDTFPVTHFVGNAKRIDLSKCDLGAGDLLTLEQFDDACRRSCVTDIKHGEFVLFHFGWSPYEHASTERLYFERNAPGLSDEVCEHVARLGVRGVGADTLACDLGMRDGEVVAGGNGHNRYFLPNGILIYEGLVNLLNTPSEFLFVGLPLKISGGSGSPVRAVALF
jgi:kynurenine formamidase